VFNNPKPHAAISAAMIPMKHSTIFKSRWMALVWSAGILLTAYQVAGSPDDDGNAVADNSLQQAAAALDGAAGK